MGAVISKCGLYRYRLERIFNHIDSDEGAARLLWVMLNPSTADATEDDATIRKCIGFASRNSFDCIEVVNLYAYRATNPKELWKTRNPIGPENNEHIVNAAIKADQVVFAWGNHGKPDRIKQVISIFDEMGHQALCLGANKNGSPKHPLMISYSQPFQVYKT